MKYSAYVTSDSKGTPQIKILVANDKNEEQAELAVEVTAFGLKSETECRLAPILDDIAWKLSNNCW